MKLKKLIPILLVLTFISFGAVGLIDSAAAADTYEIVKGCTMIQAINIGTVTCGANEAINIETTPSKGACCLFNTILRATNLVFTALIIIATLMIAFGGFTVVTSQGSDEGWTKGKNIITYAIYGIVIAILAKVIPAIALALL